jgi:hypothetical protein
LCVPRCAKLWGVKPPDSSAGAQWDAPARVQAVAPQHEDGLPEERVNPKGDGLLG